MLRLPICSIGGSERKNKCDLLQPTSHNADELIPLLDGLAVAVQLQLWRCHVVKMRELLQARMKKSWAMMCQWVIVFGSLLRLQLDQR